MIGARGGLKSTMAVARGLSGMTVWIFAAAAISFGLAFVSGDQRLRLVLGVSGAALVLVALALLGLAQAERWRVRRLARQLGAISGEDAAACFATDEQGHILFQNAAALARFGAASAQRLVSVLHEHVASPSAVLFRLQNRAAGSGSASEDIFTRRGQLRLSVHLMEGGRYFWRLDEFRGRAGIGRGADALSLPMVVANRAGVVLFSNEAMRRLVGERPKRLDRIFAQARFVSGDFVHVRAGDAPLRAIVAEVEGAGDRREIYLLPGHHAPEEENSAEFETLPVPLMKFAADGLLRNANRAARVLLPGREPGRISFHELFEDLGRPVNDWLADVASGRLPAGAEVMRLHGPDEESFVQVRLCRIVESNREGVLAILSDANALKRLEAQFNQSQKMQAIGKLAGGISHDFNNLLTAITGYCDLLLLRRDASDPDHAELEQIRQNANRAASLVRQLLAFSRKQTLTPERLELADVLSEASHLLDRLVGERVELAVSHDPLVGPIRADRRQIEQVLMNLVVNARDAMPDGGTVRLSTEALTLAEPQRRGEVTVPAGDYALIRVADTGTGIAPDQIDKIFEPFFTTKRVGEGTGLGLSTAYGIVKQSGGFIFVDSTPRVGTTFEVLFPVQELPAAEVPAQAAVVEVSPDLSHKGEGVVLLVEDEAAVRAFACRALQLQGYSVIEAASAEEALEMLENPELVVDLFITDVVMPGLDGPSWVRRALVDRPDVRVIFVSGYAEGSQSEEQARIPNSIFLPKPFTLVQLHAAVQRLLRAGSAPPDG